MDAARRLFLERGYGATTVEAISEEAAVAPATVYRLFSSKHGILKALFDVSIVGDDQAVPMAERPQVRSLITDGDAEQQLAGFVQVIVQVNERVAPLYRILVSAAGTDPEAAALLDDLTRQRQEGQRMISRSLARAVRSARSYESATPPTSSTRSGRPSCTGCWSSIEAGSQSATPDGSSTPSSTSSCPRASHR